MNKYLIIFLLLCCFIAPAYSDTEMVLDQASDIFTDTDNFDGVLSGTEDDVQKALDVLDDATPSADLDSLCSTNDRILARTIGVWGCKDYSNWDTAYGWGDHSAQNYLDLDTYPNTDTDSTNDLLNNGDTGTGNYQFDGGYFYLSGLVGIDYNPGSDVDTDIATIGVTGTPRFWWDESEGRFIFTTGITANGSATGQSTIARGLVVNESGGVADDDDFRVEATGETNAFGVDASANCLYMNSVCYTFPSSDGSSGEYLSTNASATLAWTADANTQLSEEAVEDFVGSMLGGTETLISVTYVDGTNDIDFIVDEASIDHDALTNMTPAEHLDWANSVGTIHTDNYIEDTGVPYTNLTEFVAQTAWRLFYSNTDGDVTELALGADGTYLMSNGAAVAPTFETAGGGSGPSVLDTSTTQTEFSSSTAENTLYTFSIPADTLGTDGIIEHKTILSAFNNSGGNVDYTVRIYYGATVIASYGNVLADATASDYFGISIDGTLGASAATGAQTYYARMIFNGPKSSGAQETYDYHADGNFHPTITEDSTGALTFKVTVQMDTSNANAKIKHRSTVLTLY